MKKENTGFTIFTPPAKIVDSPPSFKMEDVPGFKEVAASVKPESAAAPESFDPAPRAEKQRPRRPHLLGLRGA